MKPSAAPTHYGVPLNIDARRVAIATEIAEEPALFQLVRANTAAPQKSSTALAGSPLKAFATSALNFRRPARHRNVLESPPNPFDTYVVASRGYRRIEGAAR